jgi:hypothetical protein
MMIHEKQIDDMAVYGKEEGTPHNSLQIQQTNPGVNWIYIMRVLQ